MAPILIDSAIHTITCVATCFGYQDPGDDGHGAFGDENNNKTTVGVSIPPSIIRETIGSFHADVVHAHTVTVMCNDRIIRNVRITDDGPGELVDHVWHLLWSRTGDIGHLLDFTYGLCEKLGVKYDARLGSFRAAYWIEDSQGLPPVPKGLDAPRYWIT
jgi:hypothetical protein